MISRSRFLITAACLCHLLLATPLVTSQLLSGSRAEFPSTAGLEPPEIVFHELDSTQQPAGPATAVPAPLPADEVLLRAQQQEKDKNIFKARGHVQVNFRKYILRADYATYDASTGLITAIGHVVFDGGPHDEHLEASHGTYNVRSDSGTFYDVTGTTGMHFSGRHVILTTSNPFAFTGKVVDKLDQDHYVVHSGTVTSCKLPHPEWNFSAPKATIEVGGKAQIYNGFFRIRGVPLLYLPYADQPVQRMGRQSGFLMPTFGTSSVKGFLLGDAFYWAINRSMDATIGAELYSSRGWAQHGELRVKPSEASFLDLRYFGVTDTKGIKFGSRKITEGGQDVLLNSSEEFGSGYRAVASIEYLSSFTFRLAFNQMFTQAVTSEVPSHVFVSRNQDGFSYNADVERLQDFQANPGKPLDYFSNVILHAPSFAFSSVDRQVGSSPLYWSFDAAVEGVQRRGQNFAATPLVGRFDVYPDVTLPLLSHGWSIRPEFAVRDTAYTHNASGRDDPVNRKAAEATFEIRPPSLERTFSRQVLHHRIKHVIEPGVTYRYVAGVDNFSDILRFDERDIVSDTNEVEYGVTQRLFGKYTKCDSDCPPTREIVTWRVAQKHYFDPTFGGALVTGVRNVFESTLDFTPISFITEPRHFAPVISRLRYQAAGGLDVEWDVDYDINEGRMSASTALVNYRLQQFFLGGGHSLLRTPEVTALTTCGASKVKVPFCPFSQYRVLAGYGNPNRQGLNFAATVSVDAIQNLIQYSALQTTYNWNCCGLTFEYRRFAIGPVRSDNQFRFAFSLANIGTFGNLRKQERLF